MNLPQGQVDRQDWREHIERTKSFTGTMVTYCREQNIDYDKFMYHRGRLMKVQKAAVARAGFAKVQSAASSLMETPQTVAPIAVKAKSYPQMPDPKWLAELIHSLIRDK